MPSSVGEAAKPTGKKCCFCGTTETVRWRRGTPVDTSTGAGDQCNACYAKRRRKKRVHSLARNSESRDEDTIDGRIPAGPPCVRPQNVEGGQESWCEPVPPGNQPGGRNRHRAKRSGTAMHAEMFVEIAHHPTKRATQSVSQANSGHGQSAAAGADTSCKATTQRGLPRAPVPVALDTRPNMEDQATSNPVRAVDKQPPSARLHRPSSDTMVEHRTATPALSLPIHATMGTRDVHTPPSLLQRTKESLWVPNPSAGTCQASQRLQQVQPFLMCEALLHCSACRKVGLTKVYLARRLTISQENRRKRDYGLPGVPVGDLLLGVSLEDCIAFQCPIRECLAKLKVRAAHKNSEVWSALCKKMGWSSHPSTIFAEAKSEMDKCNRSSRTEASGLYVQVRFHGKGGRTALEVVPPTVMQWSDLYDERTRCWNMVSC